MKSKAKSRDRAEAQTLATKALEAEQIAKAARKRQLLARAEMNAARKSFKHAKRVAKRACKKARAAKRNARRKLRS
jgi:hypothetical protein